MHNPNPFDFVPFADRPFLKTPEEYDALGDHLSGYLEIRLKALTPVHIVGYQEPGEREGASFMYRQDGRPCIPAASIRGCLRAFLEALTSGWVSQATPEYPKLYRKRHVGFSTFESFNSRGRKQVRVSPPAVNPFFKPEARSDKKIDVASYLMGMVVEPQSGTQAKHEALARKAKIWIEDVFFDKENFLDRVNWVPDIKHATEDSFMGGAKPSASNWWYLQPSEIWQRSVKGHLIAEFIGDKFWGRKFYYHQNHQSCIDFYKNKWKYSSSRPLYPIRMECLAKDASTEMFRIYFDKVPYPLACLLVLILFPGKNIRHKLGYGKSYGYGSIEFSLESARLRYDDVESRIPTSLLDFTAESQKWPSYAWDLKKLNELKLDESLIDWQALSQLAKTLGWQEHDKLLFTYPPFDKKYFMQPVEFDDLKENAPDEVIVKNRTTFTSTPARQIAVRLFDIKKPIHFRQYQETAQGWNIIAQRQP